MSSRPRLTSVKTAMLEEIGEDRLNKVEAANQPMFDVNIDYDGIVSKKNDAGAKWKMLSPEQREVYKDIAAFEAALGVRDPRDSSLIPAKNLSLLMKEVRGRIDRLDPISLLAIEPLDFDDSVIELAESIENVNEIRELYKLRKVSSGSNKNSGINADEAAKIRNCFTQGRELFLAGRNGSLMVKPLNFFLRPNCLCIRGYYSQQSPQI